MSIDDRMHPEVLRAILAYAASATRTEVRRYSQQATNRGSEELHHQERLAWIAGRAVKGAVDAMSLTTDVTALEAVYCAVHEVVDCVGHLWRERLVGSVTCIATITWWPRARVGRLTLATIVEERLLLLIEELQAEEYLVMPRRPVVA
jgi:hypothetical protein